MKITPTRLRQELYRILDRVIETGVPVEIARRGKTLKIVLEEEKSRLERLEPHDIMVCDPEELVHIDWSEYWSDESPEQPGD